MPATVIVNNLTVVHRASGGTSTAAPDVCKTPTPGGPVPVPYVNVARSRDTARGSKRVRADGHPLMLKSSHFSTSAGDEPGTLGGVVSGKTRGKAYPRSYSFDVKVEGQPVFRFTDFMLQNSGSPGNAAGVESQTNAAAAATNADMAELIEMRWSRERLCCGDTVHLSVKTRSADPGQIVYVHARRTDLPQSFAMDTFPVEIQGDRADHPWISRWRFRFKETIPAVAAQATLKGAEKSSNALEFRNPPAVAKTRIIPPPVLTPRYILDTQTNEWVRHGDYFAIRAGYDLEISDGWLIVRRELDFKLQPGQNPVSPLTWREWALQIESVWDRKFFLHRVGCGRGKGCDCILMGCCKYPLRIFALQGAGHGKVALKRGGPKKEDWGKKGLWWTSHTWWTRFGDAGIHVRAHEFGHLLGCFDEYPEGACEPSRLLTKAPDSIMGGGSTVYPRHVEVFHRWFHKHAGSVIGRVVLVRI